MTMTFEELLARDGVLVYKTRGISMRPLLRQNRDLVIIRPSTTRLKKYDVALYRRGKDHVLHRVIEVKPDCYLIRGDNTYLLETVPHSDVIGVLTGFQRNNKRYTVTDGRYRLYVRLWCAIYPLRAAFVRLRHKAGRLAARLGILPVLKKMLGGK